MGDDYPRVIDLVTSADWRRLSGLTLINTCFEPNSIEKFPSKRFSVRAGIASHHDDDDVPNTRHDGKEVFSCSTNSEVVPFDVLQVMSCSLIHCKT